MVWSRVVGLFAAWVIIYHLIKLYHHLKEGK